MRIAVIHTRYRRRGGEEVVAETESRLLQQHGHEVIEIGFDNASFARHGALRVAAGTVWNRAAHHRVREVLTAVRPDVVHVHNTFPAASPAVFAAARDLPLVHTLHNYRWLCPAATLLRAGRPCEVCVGRLPVPGVIHACYGGDRRASAVVAAMLVAHRLRRTLDHVDRFIALTEFARGKFVQAGFPTERVVVKPNSAPVGPPRTPSDEPPFALFVGRLSEEKGVRVLADAWRGGGLPPLEVIGDGPARDLLEGVPGVRLVGSKTREQVRGRMASATALVMPSIWYEPLGMVVLEAFAAGLPVVASDIGGLTELVDDGVTGWRVPPGRPAELAAAVRGAFALSPAEWHARSAAAVACHGERFGPEANVAALLAVYREAAAASIAKR